ncbi:MAG: hypothetical protein M1840_008430 [Geoglossum simile]|nr:MAG: hypothetical protein M1840_008430 [Geoglossum simile]
MSQELSQTSLAEEDPGSQLLKAELGGKDAEVAKLLGNGVGPNIKNKKFGRTLLFIAAEMEYATPLLKRGADPDLVGANARTPLSYTTQKESVESIKFLLDHKADPNLADDHARTPLSYAAEKGCIELLQVLLDHGADPRLMGDHALALLSLEMALRLCGVSASEV